MSALLVAGLLLPNPAVSSESLDESTKPPGAEASEVDAFVERKKEREQELAALSRDIEISSDRQAAITREIKALDRDRETLNAKIISTSDTIKGLETELTDTERRLMSLGENEDAVRLSLIARRDVLAEVLAALQRIGKRPPPALAVRPSDALSAVRSAILLNAVMVVKTETERASKAREMVFELLAADQPSRDAHPDPESDFWKWSDAIGVTQSRFAPCEKPAQDISHPAIAVNLDACIACNLCERACREVQVNDVIGMLGRDLTRAYQLLTSSSLLQGTSPR